ncbi:hypothetical protein HanXRQr2_Chr11g0517771 [Helianthus annuus]|uniref:Uncharacterized protein n=1 Tax=Helianthus annuus TaxID=4232 RepID=A0A9K3HTY4_HELAN|nr:hypothetical protein HanXRQr2_Chr11g0517771 [Helianthus annuus]
MGHLQNCIEEFLKNYIASSVEEIPRNMEHHVSRRAFDINSRLFVLFKLFWFETFR